MQAMIREAAASSKHRAACKQICTERETGCGWCTPLFPRSHRPRHRAGSPTAAQQECRKQTQAAAAMAIQAVPAAAAAAGAVPAAPARQSARGRRSVLLAAQQPARRTTMVQAATATTRRSFQQPGGVRGGCRGGASLPHIGGAAHGVRSVAQPAPSLLCVLPTEEQMVVARLNKPSTPEEEALAEQIRLHESWAAGAASGASRSQWQGQELLQAYDRQVCWRHGMPALGQATWIRGSSQGCTCRTARLERAGAGAGLAPAGIQHRAHRLTRSAGHRLRPAACCRCGEVTSEYAKTFFLGTQLMTAEQAKAIWAIYVWCR